MEGVYKLHNKIMRYDWGSTRYIPEFLGAENRDSKPYAELWMGTHPKGESRALLGKDEKPLSQISGGLPFLFKLLAAEKPLSIQVHPDKAQAEAGYARENTENIPLDSPERCYKDKNHKPEILCALTPFRALCGFREPRLIKHLLEIFSSPPVKKLRQIFDSAGNDAPRLFLRSLFNLSNSDLIEISEFIKKNIQGLKNEYKEYSRELDLIKYLEEIFPCDPSALSPLYLNVIDLPPGEAVFLPAGILHSYIHGAGVEVMASSDNVIRGGLTSKHIDHAELFRVSKFAPFKPDIYKPQNHSLYKYPAPVKDFTLYCMNNGGGEAAFPASRAAIFFCTGGSACFCLAGSEKITAQKGESVFIAENSGGNLRLSGMFSAYVAE
ncbi:MAG: mannose-6-phosphate isomerase, class I [Spirochaetaceae bacterium]|jgi:mannose-6-phosphate isomerase|nr:mannose-6-phosphate isomerase, class I [Spirochaetaceae bacterium]